jgi:hypothetical protein
MLSFPVTVTCNAPRPALSAATTKSRPVTRLLSPPKSKFQIAIPRLEFPLTHTLQTPLIFSNRGYMRVLHPPWRIAVFRSAIATTPSLLGPGLPGNADLRIGVFAFRPRLSYRRHPCRRLCLFPAHHSSLSSQSTVPRLEIPLTIPMSTTSKFLIYGKRGSLHSLHTVLRHHHKLRSPFSLHENPNNHLASTDVLFRRRRRCDF